MRKTLAAGMAALSLGGALATAALPGVAAAERHGYYGGYGGYGDYYGGHHDDHHHHNDAGVAIAAGVVGLALGAALASSSHPHDYYSHTGYPAYGYGPGYYSYGYAPYATCESHRWVWDPYIGRQVMITTRYAC